MKMNVALLTGLFALAGVRQPIRTIRAAEHPKEHPQEHSKEGKKKGSKEHPEDPKNEKQTRKAASPVTMDGLAQAIKKYVEKEASLKGGYFMVYDPVAKQPLALTLDKVHKDRLSKVAEDTYFACADFKTPEGKVYDLDVFMKGPDAASLQVTEVSIHKESGKARYGWVEENGIWKKKQN